MDDLKRLHAALCASQKRLLAGCVELCGELPALVPDAQKLAQTVVLLQSSEHQQQLKELLDARVALAVTLALAARPLSPMQIEELQVQALAFLADSGAWAASVTALEQQLRREAPNLCALLGVALAARVLSATGGLACLARLPASAVEGLNAPLQPQGGFLFEHPALRDVDDRKIKMKGLRLLANTIAKASRVDFGGEKGAAWGLKALEKLERDIERRKAPKPTPSAPPLPAPDDGPKRRRGGKRFRRLKERLGLTQIGRLKNRVALGTDFAEEAPNQVEGLGLLAQNGLNILRIKARLGRKQSHQARPKSK